MIKRKAKIRQAVRGNRSGQWTFTLWSDNSKQIAHSQQWYANYDDMVNVLNKYFPDFKIVETK